MKLRVSAFATLEGAEALASAKVSDIVPITTSTSNRSFGFAAVDDELILVEGETEVRIPNIILILLSISAYNVREEHRQGGETRLDLIHCKHRCIIVYWCTVLPAHSKSSIPSYGMSRHPYHTFQSSPSFRISMHCPKDRHSIPPIGSLHRTQRRPISYTI